MPVAAVTGVGRTNGIAFAAARRLLADGHRVLASTHPAYDAEYREWGTTAIEGSDIVATAPAGELGVSSREIVASLDAPAGRLAVAEADLERPEAPRALLEQAVREFGGIDIVVAAHSRSSDYPLEALTAEELDRTWAINARASVLLVQALAALHDAARGGGRAVLFTSGQHIAPMASEIPYAISKGAIHQMTRTLADAVADRGITVNAINPGPVDTGWPSPELKRRLTAAFPAGRWGEPDDIAPVVAWLASPDSAWMTGQVLDVEGGFRRAP